MKKILIAILLCLCIGVASPILVACGGPENQVEQPGNGGDDNTTPGETGDGQNDDENPGDEHGDEQESPGEQGDEHGGQEGQEPGGQGGEDSETDPSNPEDGDHNTEEENPGQSGDGEEQGDHNEEQGKPEVKPGLTEEVIQTVLDQLNEMTIYCYSEELATFSEARGAFIIDLGAEFAADADGLVELLPEYLTSFNYSYILEDPCLVITILFE